MLPVQPHDALTRYAWSDLPTARAHFQTVLPPDLVAVLDWSSLALCPGTLVNETLRAVHTDLLFSVRTRSGTLLRLYLLFEHQSTPDTKMPLRLLRYLVRGWEAQLRADPPEPLVPIVPLVLYHGAASWTVAPNLAGMLDLPASEAALLGPYLPDFRYILQDLSPLDDAELRGTALGRMALLLLKHAHDGDLWARLPGWLDTMERVRDETASGLDAVEALLRYMLLVAARAPGAREREAVRRRLGAHTEEHLMTWAEQMWEQAEARGEKKGEARGIEKGIEQGARGTLLRSIERALAVRFPDDDLAPVLRGLSRLDHDALDRAFGEAVRAPTLAAFADSLGGPRGGG